MLYTLGLLVVVVLGLAAYVVGMLFNFLCVLLIVAAPVCLVKTVWTAFRKQLYGSFIRHPFRASDRPYLRQLISQWIFWLLVLSACQVALVPAQFTPEEALDVRIILWGCGALLIGLSLFPHRKIRRSTHLFGLTASALLTIELARIFWPLPATNAVTLAPPFQGEWLIIQGGRSALINHHYALASQRHALDILQPADPSLVRAGKLELAQYPTFGQQLYAPAAGQVVTVVSDRPDMPIGQTDPQHIEGNHIVLDIGGGSTGDGKYVLMAHLQQGSPTVKPGDRVQSGQPIARIGNSGNTSEPHLHLQVQTQPSLQTKNVRTYPIYFQAGTRKRNGRSTPSDTVSLRRNDVITFR